MLKVRQKSPAFMQACLAHRGEATPHCVVVLCQKEKLFMEAAFRRTLPEEQRHGTQVHLGLCTNMLYTFIQHICRCLASNRPLPMVVLQQDYVLATVRCNLTANGVLITTHLEWAQQLIPEGL